MQLLSKRSTDSESGNLCWYKECFALSLSSVVFWVLYFFLFLPCNFMHLVCLFHYQLPVHLMKSFSLNSFIAFFLLTLSTSNIQLVHACKILH